MNLKMTKKKTNHFYFNSLYIVFDGKIGNVVIISLKSKWIFNIMCMDRLMENISIFTEHEDINTL